MFHFDIFSQYIILYRIYIIFIDTRKHQALKLASVIIFCHACTESLVFDTTFGYILY